MMTAATCQPDEIESVVNDFITMIGTRSDAPLSGTVWECDMEGKYNLYLLFGDEGVVSTFYGKIDDEYGLQRWSDFYEGTYSVNKGQIGIDLTYPSWGESSAINTIGMVRVQDDFTLVSGDGLVFRYYGKDVEGLDEIWMTLFVDIMPWN